MSAYDDFLEILIDVFRFTLLLVGVREMEILLPVMIVLLVVCCAVG